MEKPELSAAPTGRVSSGHWFFFLTEMIQHGADANHKITDRGGSEHYLVTSFNFYFNPNEGFPLN